MISNISFCCQIFEFGLAYFIVEVGYHINFWTSNTADDKFNPKLISEFDGNGSIVEWVEKVELVCNYSGVKWLETIILFDWLERHLQCISNWPRKRKWMQHQLRTCYTPLLLWTVSLHMTSSKSETAPRWNCRHLLGQFEKVGGTVQKNAQPCVCQCNPHLHLMTYLVRLQDRFTAAWVTGLGTYEEESEKKLVAAAAYPK